MHHVAKGCRVLLAGLLIAMGSSGAALGAADPLLTYFHGGRMNLRIGLNSMMLTGPGSGSVAGGAAAPSVSDAFAAFRNPAGMRFVRGRAAIGFTFHPQLLLPFSKMPVDIDASIRDAVDGFTENFQKPDNSLDYPELGGSVSRTSSSLTSFGMVIPVGRSHVGLAYGRPLHLSLDMLLGGFRQRIDTEGNTPEESIGFAIQTRISNRMVIDTDRWSLAFAHDLGRHVTLGASVARTRIDISWFGGYNVDGIMTRGTQQYAFNNTNDPWYNDLHSFASGGYSGSLWTIHAGAILASASDRGWRLGIDYTHNTQPTLTGGLGMLVDQFPALKLQTTGDEQPFDANLISPDEPTRTYPKQFIAGSNMRIHVPSSLSIGVSRGSGWRPSLTYTFYTGDRLSFDLRVREKRVNEARYSARTYGRGLVPKWEAYFGIHPGGFFLGLGGIKVEDYISGYSDSNGEPIPGGTSMIIPRFDMGFSFHVIGSLKADILLAGLPEDVLRVSLLYDF